MRWWASCFIPCWPHLITYIREWWVLISVYNLHVLICANKQMYPWLVRRSVCQSPCQSETMQQRARCTLAAHNASSGRISLRPKSLASNICRLLCIHYICIYIIYKCIHYICIYIIYKLYFIYILCLYVCVYVYLHNTHIHTECTIILKTAHKISCMCILHTHGPLCSVCTRIHAIYIYTSLSVCVCLSLYIYMQHAWPSLL